MPFVGLVEGFVVATFVRAGLAPSRVRAAVGTLRRDLGVPYALASRRLLTRGPVILSGQSDVVSTQLDRLEYDEDDYARRLHLPGFRVAKLVIDPEHGFGGPHFVNGGARLEDVLDLYAAGASTAVIEAEFGVPRPEIDDVVAGCSSVRRSGRGGG